MQSLRSFTTSGTQSPKPLLSQLRLSLCPWIAHQRRSDLEAQMLQNRCQMQNVFGCRVRRVTLCHATARRHAALCRIARSAQAERGESESTHLGRFRVFKNFKWRTEDGDEPASSTREKVRQLEFSALAVLNCNTGVPHGPQWVARRERERRKQVFEV